MRRIAISAAVLAAALALPGPLRTYFFERNRMPVVAGVYRSAQPSAEDLDAWIPELGLRSVLNLRGESAGTEWLRAEREVSERHDVEHYTVRLSADHMPPAQRLRDLVTIFDNAPRPLLLHCEAGVERSGLAGAVAVLLEGGSVDTARAQFAASKGYIQFIARSDLPLVLDDYERWLGQRGAAHTADRFRTWARDLYVPDFYSVRIEPLSVPTKVALGSAPVLRFRVTNTSERAIPFRSGDTGVRIGAWLRAAGADVRQELRGQPVDVLLEPGESLESSLALPALAQPGRCELVIDLVNEHVKWFAQMGSEPLVLSLEVVAGDGA